MADKYLPAFPRDHAHEGHNGMTLRDYFAAKAMQMLLLDDIDFSERIRIAEKAYDFADAMLVARVS
jgi:hypothetical protein